MRFLLGLQSMQTLLNNGDDLYERGQFSEALHRYELALQKEDAHSSQAARIQHKIGLTLSQLGDSFKSMNCFQVALKIFQDSDDLGPGSQDAAETTAQMIRILDKIRLESGVGERKFVKGAESTHVGVDVGMNLLEWADYKEAEKTLKECLAENGNDDAKSSAVTEDEKVKAICTLGKLSQAQGRYDEAKRLYLEALKNAKQIAGPESEIDEQIVESIAGYAEILRKSGDLWQAEALHKKVRSMLLVLKDKMDDSDSVISEEVSIEHDLRLAVSHTQLGCTYFELRRYDSGLGEHQAALQIRLRHVDGNDALVSESLNYTAETLCALKQYPKALPLSMHAVAIRFREFGPSHPAYAVSVLNYACLSCTLLLLPFCTDTHNRNDSAFTVRVGSVLSRSWSIERRRSSSRSMSRYLRRYIRRPTSRQFHPEPFVARRHLQRILQFRRGDKVVYTSPKLSHGQLQNWSTRTYFRGNFNKTP